MAEFLLKKGSRLPQHSHPHEQTGYLVKGRIRLFIGSTKNDVVPGDSWCIPSGVEHGAEILEDSVAIEVFSPVREDYLPMQNRLKIWSRISSGVVSPTISPNASNASLTSMAVSSGDCSVRNPSIALAVAFIVRSRATFCLRLGTTAGRPARPVWLVMIKNNASVNASIPCPVSAFLWGRAAAAY
jgi:hypothetical protein